MAEWVLVGNIRGPQGDQGEQGEPGQDAQLPSGGTAGQFLQKSADGETWADAVSVTEDSVLNVNGKPVDSILLYDYDKIEMGFPPSYILLSTVHQETSDISQFYVNCNGNRVGVIVYEDRFILYLGDYAINSVANEAINDTGSKYELVTSAAVIDYVSNNKGDKLPEGGTDGQVLTKTADGEEWLDTQLHPDALTLSADGHLQKSRQDVTNIKLYDDAALQEASIGIIGSEACVSFGDGMALLGFSDTGARLKMMDKEVAAITDAVGNNPYGNKLVTDKAVADYVAENAPETPEASSTQYGTVKFASDEDFYEYMGISTWEELWTGSTDSRVTVYQNLSGFDNLRITYTYSAQSVTVEIPAIAGTYDTADYGDTRSHRISVANSYSYFTVSNSDSWGGVTFTKVEGK